MLKFGIPTLVLRQFDIDDQTTDKPAIEITGRATGFLSWLLTVMKLSTLTTLRLDSDRLSVVTTSLSGEIHTVIPLSAIDSTQCGFSKTSWFLGVAVALLLLGISSGVLATFLIALILAAIFGAVYFYSDKMFISVAAGGTNVAIAYKKGAIDGVTVDLDRTLQAIKLLNQGVLRERSR